MGGTCLLIFLGVLCLGQVCRPNRRRKNTGSLKRKRRALHSLLSALVFPRSLRRIWNIAGGYHFNNGQTTVCCIVFSVMLGNMRVPFLTTVSSGLIRKICQSISPWCR